MVQFSLTYATYEVELNKLVIFLLFYHLFMVRRLVATFWGSVNILYVSTKESHIIENFS